MRLALGRRQRATLLFLSASGYVAWLAGLGSDIEAQGIAPRAPTTLQIVEPGRSLNVAALIRRDPFAGKPQNRFAFVGARGASPARLAPAALDANDQSGIDVPNIAATPGVGAQTHALTLSVVLRATIIGPNPVAYVQNGTAMDIVRVGDSLGERRVAKIDLRGIAFADGTRLDLPQAGSSGAPTSDTLRASAPATAHPVTLEDLRRLLLQHAPARAVSQSTPAGASPTSTLPVTPGPLPTVDQRGLPVGTNPTPDPNGPTAFPYPYPYAPPAPHER